MGARRPALGVAFYCCILFLLANEVVAQPVWTDKFTARGFTVDFLKPMLKDNETFGGATSLTFVSGRFPVSKTLRIKPEIPIGYASPASGTNATTEFVLGNPYVGLEVLGEDGSSTAEIGFRLPAIYDPTPLTAIAAAADFDRFEAFVHDAAAVTGSFVGRNRSNAIEMHVAGGVTLLVPFDDRDTDLYGQYSVQIVYDGGRVGFITGFAGRLLFTEGDLSFGERAEHQVGFSAILYLGAFRPGVMLRLPVDDPLRESVNAVLGFNISYELF